MIIRFRIAFSVLIIALLFTAGCGGQLNNQSDSVPLKIEILEDEDNNRTFEDITAGEYSFSIISEQNRNIGFSGSAWWIKVSLTGGNLPDGDYILFYNNYWAKTVDAYVSRGEDYISYKAGNENGFKARPVPDRGFAFPVNIKNSKAEIYLKIKSIYRIVLDISLMDRESFLSRKSFVEPFYAIILSFILYNIILFFVIRSKEYLYYCCFLATYLVFLLSFDGTGFMYFWQESPAWDDFALTGMLIFQSFWAILFFITLTGSAETYPGVTKFLRVLAVMTIPAALLKIIFPSMNVLFMSLPLLQIIALTLISFSLYMAINGSWSAGYFFISFVILLIFSLANSLTSFGIIADSQVVRLGMHIGASISAVTFSLGMADRINRLRKSKDLSEQELKIQNMKLEKTNDELDATNQELHAAMEEMEAANEEMQAIMDELHESNKLLWESEQHLNGIVNTAPIGIILTDLQGRITQINDYALKMLDYTKDEITGMTFVELSHPDDITEGFELFSLLKSGGVENYRLDKRYKRKDGADWWADVSASALKSETGEINSILGIALDINDKVEKIRENEKIQNQLWQAQKLDAVGTLAGGIAHDFNNILTAIMGYTELSIAEIKDGVCNEDNLKQILIASKRARDIVRQILTLSRKGDNIRAPHNIAQIIEETITLIRATLPSTIDIIFNNENGNTTVLCDSTQLQQVLLNLCTNASHAMHDNGGLLTISLSNTAIDADTASSERISSGDYILLTVSDTGTGMNRDILERIFDPFFTTKAPGLGTGLGLSVVRGIIIDHGGTISAESEEGKGSIFTIRLPISSASDTGFISSIAPDNIPGGNERILIVDDEHVIAEMTKLILQKLGYSVQTAPGSLEALEIFRNSPLDYDLVITDQTMPHMTGLTLVKEIRSIRPDIPVILCTGFSETADSGKVREYNVNELLHKPVLTEDLAEAIRRVLEKDDNREIPAP